MRVDVRPLALLVSLAACSAETTGPSDAGGLADVAVRDASVPAPDVGGGRPDATAPPPDAGPPDAVAPPDSGEPVASPARRLRFKRFDQLRLELQRVLSLPEGEVCNELDRFGCAEEVHRVALGGTDPYFANVYVPAAEPPLNAPLAWERVALTACAERVDRDVADPDAAAWLVDVELDPQGQIDPSAPPVTAAVRSLYREALSREPSVEELQAWRDAYVDLESSELAPARAWARLVCGAVLTSAEFVFY